MKRYLSLCLVMIAVLTGCQQSSTAPEQATITIAITDTGVSPNGESVEVRQGGSVTISVTSTRETDIHVHGYEVELHVVPGTPATTTFTADQAGSFEVETHDPATLVAQLVVRA